MADLLRYYRELPERGPDEDASAWDEALRHFGRAVEGRYLEGTLQRLLHSSHTQTRQAAVLALSLRGTMASNQMLARRLRDSDETVRQFAVDALWAVWLRADTPANNRELQRLRHLGGFEEGVPEKLLAGFAALLQKAPIFAEAYNQRAILYFRLGQWQNAIRDCERVLRLNPYHFGAAAGMAQCYLKQKKMRGALKAYRRAYQINPNMEGVQQVIRSLERLLGEEGKR